MGMSGFVVRLVCSTCGVEFDGKPSRRFCSPVCYWASMRTPVEPRPCERCGTVFTPLGKFPDQRFCSRACSTKATVPRGERHYLYRGPVRKAGRGYLARAGSSRMQHHEVWWAANPDGRCGDCDGPVHHVHHLDEDPQNNDLTNLIGLCARCHSRRHKEAHRGNG